MKKNNLIPSKSYILFSKHLTTDDCDAKEGAGVICNTGAAIPAGYSSTMLIILSLLFLKKH
jgi:hypothetical protein